MKIFTMGDLHLPFGSYKPMDIFGGWDGYTEKILENWNAFVSDEDLVVVPGDICWAMGLEQAKPDFDFINNKLNGKKILLKGNHDYWWNTMSKMNTFLLDNGFDKIQILSNNAFSAKGISICGTRGWINDTGEAQDQKVLAREAGRLELSIQAGIKLGGEPVVFIHYPPIYGTEENYYILEILHKYEIKRCFYGHVHGSGFAKAFQGERDGVNYKMVSADYVKFTPVLVQE